MNISDENPFYDKMGALSDAELLKVIKMREQYQPQASEAAKVIAIRRGLIDDNFNLISGDETLIEEDKKMDEKDEEHRKRKVLKKKKSPKRIITLVLTLAALIISAYFVYDNYRFDNVKESVKQSIEQKMNEKVSKMTILHKSGNDYTGLVEFESKREMGIILTVDGSTYMWKSDGQYELKKALEGISN